MTSPYIFFLGSHPDLSAAEAWGVLQSQGFAPAALPSRPDLLHVTLHKPLPATFLTTLGGTDRIANVLGSLPAPLSAPDVFDLITTDVPAPKYVIGLSALGLPDSFNREIGSALKKHAREHLIRVKFILPSPGSRRLNAAQVTFNKLTTIPDQELTFIKENDNVTVARTVAVQDIAAYELRDTARPARDAKIGLLPPKLAQIMLNLSLSHLPSPPPLSALPRVIYDPFCGFGTILQEAWLRNIKSHGSDVNPDMIKASEQNLAWIREHFSVAPENTPELFTHNITQPLPPKLHNFADAIVTEPYLGQPLFAPLPQLQRDKHQRELATLYLAATNSLAAALKPNGVMIMLLPAWRTVYHSASFSFMPPSFLDAIARQGYSQIQLVHSALPTKETVTSSRGTLLYARPDALVGREFTLWQRRVILNEVKNLAVY